MVVAVPIMHFRHFRDGPGTQERAIGPGPLSSLQGHMWAREPHGVNSNVATKIFAFSLNDRAFLFYGFIWRVHVYVLF